MGQSPPTTASPSGLTRQDTNPFARHRLSVNPQFGGSSSSVATTNSFSPATPTTSAASSVHSTPLPTQPVQLHRTGTNPFARTTVIAPPEQNPQQPLRPNPTGSTNPFRQSAFINQQTGQGWHMTPQQTTMGGLEHLETLPVFPRPGMA